MYDTTWDSSYTRGAEDRPRGDEAAAEEPAAPAGRRRNRPGPATPGDGRPSTTGSTETQPRADLSRLERRERLGEPRRHADRAQASSRRRRRAPSSPRRRARRARRRARSRTRSGSARRGGRRRASRSAARSSKRVAGQVADVRLDRRHVDAVLLDEPVVAAGEPREVGDPGDLEPDEVDGVVHDALRVGLAEAHAQVGRETKSVHGSASYDPGVDDVRLLAELIRDRRPCVALTGAGCPPRAASRISARRRACGPTVDPREYASLSAFRRNPERVWSFYATRYRDARRR